MESNKVEQVVIIGSGPAGHTAAIYCARANLNPVMIEGSNSDFPVPGGQLTTTTDVENFPGFPNGILGYDLMENMRKQSEHCGTKIITERVNKVDFSQQPFTIFYGEENKFQIKAYTVIIATGANAKKLQAPGVDTYWNKGISACAVCDGALPIFRNKPLVVIGGGDSAMEEATHLSKFGSKVYLIHRSDKFRASKVMLNRVQNNPKIEIVKFHTLEEAVGQAKLSAVRLKNVQTNEIKEIECSGLFFAIGHVPNTQFLDKQITLDEDGYIITHDNVKTNIEGVFACGDVQDKKWRQAITAAGSGCMAALSAEHYLSAKFQASL